MTWLLGKVVGNPLLLIWIAAGAFAFGLASGGGTAWTVQGWRLGKVKAEYAGFVATTKVTGDAAKKASDLQTATDKRIKEQADNENKRTLAALRADVKRLRDANTSGGGLSAPSPTAESPTRTCFDPAKLSAALRSLDEGILGIVESGSEAAVNLDTARAWAQGRP